MFVRGRPSTLYIRSLHFHLPVFPVTGTGTWFQLHRGFMIGTTLVCATTIAVIFGFVKEWTHVNMTPIVLLVLLLPAKNCKKVMFSQLSVCSGGG